MDQLLILNPYYYPGFRSGGPQQTVMNIAETFGDQCDIRILTQDHDLGQEKPYEGVPVGEWVPVGKAKVKYLPGREYGCRRLREEYDRFNRIYTCGLFEKNTLAILSVHRFSRKKKQLYVAPMGVFSAGAIRTKALKKRVFLWVYGMLGMFRDVTWSFTSELEEAETKKVLGRLFNSRYLIAEDLPRKIDFAAQREKLQTCRKGPGALNIIFLSRICPKKNLAFCGKVLNAVYDGQIRFNIYGVIEDREYWDRCGKAFAALPGNVTVRYWGEVEPERVIDVFRKNDIFLFPTRGENYGHVIYEALAAGCLPVISDQTPWQDLDALGCGSVLPLDDEAAFQEAVRHWLRASRPEMTAARERAVRCAEERYAQAVSGSGYADVLGI